VATQKRNKKKIKARIFGLKRASVDEKGCGLEK
jgi:hypothetical protein